MKKILAIGGGGAGMFSCVVPVQLKPGKFSAIVLSDEKDIYCRCTTPYIMTGNATLKDAIQPDSMVGDYGVKIVHEKALKLNTAKRQVVTDKGNIYPYDYLVISTGATPLKPNIEGVDLRGVFTIRNSQDVKNLHDYLKNAKKAVVVGAGVIGIEMAGALRKRGVGVSLLEKAPDISPQLADEEFAVKIKKLLLDNKIDIHFNAEVEKISEGKGKKKSIFVRIANETKELKADVVIFAVGVKPNIDVLKGTGIKISEKGVVVDEKMRTNVKNIYACGDCCVPLSSVTGEFKPSPLASSAIQQSKIVGFQIAKYPISYNGSTGAFAFETLGKQYSAVGLTETVARKKFKFVITGKAKTTDIYNDLKEHEDLEVKLIFAGPKMRIVGYEAFGRGVISSAELASFAIGLRLSVLSMLKFNYIAHPSMTPWPFMNPIIMASEDAMGNLMKKFRSFFVRK